MIRSVWGPGCRDQCGFSELLGVPMHVAVYHFWVGWWRRVPKPATLRPLACGRIVLTPRRSRTHLSACSFLLRAGWVLGGAKLAKHCLSACVLSSMCCGNAADVLRGASRAPERPRQDAAILAKRVPEIVLRPAGITARRSDIVAMGDGCRLLLAFHQLNRLWPSARYTEDALCVDRHSTRREHTKTVFWANASCFDCPDGVPDT